MRPTGSAGPQVLLVVHSYHHGNTRKLAEALAEALPEAIIVKLEDFDPELLEGFELLGLGSGIDSGRHYRPLLELAERLPKVRDKRAFIFSTCGIPAALARGGILERQIETNHAALRGIVLAKGYIVAGEYGCLGFNTNSFLRRLGGVNKGRPDARDLEGARNFARGLMRSEKGMAC